MSATRHSACPKCGKARAGDTAACPRCGLLFALWQSGEVTEVAGLDQAGEALWDRVEEDFADSARHEALLKHCVRTGLLAAAGRRYRNRLDRNPKDALAAEMQAQVLARATLGLSLARRTPKTALTRSRGFWTMVSAALALGIAAGLYWRRLR